MRVPDCSQRAAMRERLNPGGLRGKKELVCEASLFQLDQLLGYTIYHPEVVGSNPSGATTWWREMFRELQGLPSTYRSSHLQRTDP